MEYCKEYTCNKADEIALEKYDNDFYELNESQQKEVWELAEQAWRDYYASLIDAEYERRKYGHIKTI